MAFAGEMTLLVHGWLIIERELDFVPVTHSQSEFTNEIRIRSLVTLDCSVTLQLRKRTLDVLSVVRLAISELAGQTKHTVRRSGHVHRHDAELSAAYPKA